jgi:hypothetical protein
VIILASASADVATVASALFAAIAAGASWATVAQNRKERELAQAPDLSVRLSLTQGTLLLRVHNVGGGPANGVNYLITHDDNITWDVVANGYLGPGEDTQFFKTSMPASRTLAGNEYVCVVPLGTAAEHSALGRRIRASARCSSRACSGARPRRLNRRSSPRYSLAWCSRVNAS